jgi:hypothetical protein
MVVSASAAVLLTEGACERVSGLERRGEPRSGTRLGGLESRMTGFILRRFVSATFAVGVALVTLVASGGPARSAPTASAQTPTTSVTFVLRPRALRGRVGFDGLPAEHTILGLSDI